MKKLMKGVVVSMAAVAALAMVSCGGAKKSSAVDIELWYGAAASEAGPIPADWVGYQIVKDKLGINLKLTNLPSSEADQNTKINAAGAANTLPDIFMVSNEVFSTLVSKKLLAPVDSMYAKMPNRTAKMYDKDSRAFTTIDGHSYALAQPGSIVRNEGVLIRKDWLDKLGLKVPKTTDEYLAVMKAFTEKDPDGNGKNDTYGYGAFLEVSAPNEGLGRRLDPIFGAFGVAGTWNLASAKTAGLNIYKPEYYDAMVFTKSMVDSGVMDPNWLAYKKDDFRAAWKQGRFGIMREQNAAYANQGNYAPFDNNFPEGEWVIVEPPVGPKGQSSAGTYSQAYRMYAVSTKAAKEGKMDKIAELLEWMSSDEGYYLLGWGQENVNYVFDKNGVPTTTGLADPSKGYTESAMIPLTQLRNMVYYNGDVELTSRYPTWYSKNGKEMSALKALREMQAKSWTACIGQDKMPKPNADVKRFYEQGVVEFMTGNRALNPTEWQKFLDEFTKIGGKEWEEAGLKIAKEQNLLK